jgi:hypothetical protein
VLGFLPYKNLPVRASWVEPTLEPFYLFLEHAEYTGFTYEQTRRIYHTARQDSVQVRLIPMSAVLRQYRASKASKQHLNGNLNPGKE